MIYAICTQGVTDAVRGVLGETDTVQTIKDCHSALAEAQRLPIDTLILDIATIRSADDVLAYQTTVRRCPRIIVFAPDRHPGDRVIGRLVGYGIYDIVTDPGRLSDELSHSPATIVQAARWIVKDQNDRRSSTKVIKRLINVGHIGKHAFSAIADGLRRLGTAALLSAMRVLLKQENHNSSKFARITTAKLKQDVNNKPTPPVFSEENLGTVTDTAINSNRCSGAVGISVPDPVSLDIPIWVKPQPIKSEPPPDKQQPRRQSVHYHQVLRVITVESGTLACALIILVWRMTVLSVQLLPYALAMEVAVLLGYIPHWASVPAYGYWSILHGVDPHVWSMSAAWHHITRFAAFIGGGKA